MSISYYDFKNLPSQSQYELVIEEGQVINETYKNELKFILYGMSSFSVEIVINISNNKIASLRVFHKKGNL
ncbi:hypothetical protein K0U91_12185 [Chryseobacterium chendengshani]|uniref:hypothetical protein n=1 Tax=Chryseobacterium sp. LJ668 TaxID=2864040 RepID=UPI001C68A295|nr:hypothetical protein [Chryseobacterium sp. LJ668]MBW8523529.1 hypothetical protein [Chryseobacterium sp. LJ668]QYK15812.1 hypothetical protein K0U91_12185 [Chryseobacterium sp. LJ668]